MDVVGGSGGRTGRLGLTDIHNPVRDRELVASCGLAQRAQLGALMTQKGGRNVQEGGDVCIQRADLLHCTEESNTAL